MKCPYTFPHRTRAAMLAYLGEHESYVPMNTWNRGFVLSWNVKIYRVNEMGKSGGCDCPTQERFDAAWREYIDGHDIFFDACADAARQYLDGEWTNWPGIEQGEWKFALNGRSGGHMILTDAPAWLPPPRGWACCKLTWEDRDDYQDWLNNLDTKTLRQFYRAIRVLDRDLRREACEQEVSYQIAFRRSCWEEGLIEQETCDARRLEASRPDLYGRAS